METLPEELLSKIHADNNLSFNDIIELSLTNKINEVIVGSNFYDILNTLYDYNKWIFTQFYNCKDEAILDIFMLIEKFPDRPMKTFRFEDIYDFIYLYEEYFYGQIRKLYCNSSDGQVHYKNNIGNYIYYYNYQYQEQELFENDQYTFILTHKNYFDEDNIKSNHIYDNLHCNLKNKIGLTLHAIIIYNDSFPNELYWFNNGVLNNTDEGGPYPAYISCTFKYRPDKTSLQHYTYVYYKIKTIRSEKFYRNGIEYIPA